MTETVKQLKLFTAMPRCHSLSLFSDLRALHTIAYGHTTATATGGTPGRI